MSYVPRFEYDIFVSFTHADNGRLPGQGVGWVDEFHYQLENSLARRRGLEGLRIWRDRELDGNTVFDIAIEDKLDSTALLFVLHSHAYRKSNYCQKELDCFYRQHWNSLLVGENKRIFNILLDNYSPNEWHPALGGAIGFPMHDAEGDELGDRILPTDPEYLKRLRPIVDAAETILKAMRAQAEAALPLPQVPDDQAVDRPRIFLACVSDAQDDLRERLITEIGDRAAILDPILPPWEQTAHAEAVTATLGQADLSIHLLGAWPGPQDKGPPGDQLPPGAGGNHPGPACPPDSLATEGSLARESREPIPPRLAPDAGVRVAGKDRDRADSLQYLQPHRPDLGLHQGPPEGFGSRGGDILSDRHPS